MFKEHKTLFSILVCIVCLLFLVLIISGIIGIINKLTIGDKEAYKDTISIRGEGRVYVKPDLALVNLSVVTEGSNINNVQKQNSEKMNRVINFLKEFGVEEKDIKTTNYNLYPRYNYENRRIPQIIGYEITQTLEVKVRNLEKIGDILDKSVDIGINQINYLRFTVDNEEKSKEEAREIAINDAKKKAEKLASQLGIKLGKIIGYNDESGFAYPLYREGIGGGGEVPQIEVGENEIAVNVTLIFEIK